MPVKPLEEVKEEEESVMEVLEIEQGYVPPPPMPKEEGYVPQPPMPKEESETVVRKKFYFANMSFYE